MMKRRITLRDCKDRASMIARTIGLQLYVNVETGRPRLLVNRGTPADEKWREAIPALRTSEFLIALNAFEQGAVAAVHKEVEP